MERHDIWVIGHVTRDRIETHEGFEVRAGGTATYSSLALARLAVDVGVLTRLAPEDEAELLAEHRAAGLDVVYAPSAKTTEFENRYPAGNPDQRFQRVGAVALPFVAEDVRGKSGRIFHLGPLTAEDMPLEFLRAVAERGRVSLDVQGFVRRIERGRVELCDWPEKRPGLRCVRVLKADESEARVLTGEGDPARAARTLATWGPDEVLVTCASRGSFLAWDGTLRHVPAIETPDAEDPTGCGDTYMAGYLCERLAGRTPLEAARFASAAAASKLRHTGPFAGTRESVEAALRERSGSPARDERAAQEGAGE